jgi:hypothetical protein
MFQKLGLSIVHASAHTHLRVRTRACGRVQIRLTIVTSDAESMHRAKRDTYNNANTDTHGSGRRKRMKVPAGAGTTCGETVRARGKGLRKRELTPGKRENVNDGRES